MGPFSKSENRLQEVWWFASGTRTSRQQDQIESQSQLNPSPGTLDASLFYLKYLHCEQKPQFPSWLAGLLQHWLLVTTVLCWQYVHVCHESQCKIQPLRFWPWSGIPWGEHEATPAVSGLPRTSCFFCGSMLFLFPFPTLELYMARTGLSIMMP